MVLMAGAFRTAVRDGSDEGAREQMALAATFAGMGFGNAGVHVPHANAYPIAGRVKGFRPAGYPQDEPMVPHGMAVALTAPAAFGFTYDADPGRHLRAAQLLDGSVDARVDDADALPRVLTAIMEDVGLPDGLAAVGYLPSDVDDLVAGALQQPRLLATAPKPVAAEDLAGIFERSMTVR